MTTHTLAYAGQSVSMHRDDTAALRFLSFLFHDVSSNCQQSVPVTVLELMKTGQAATYLLKENGEVRGSGCLGVGLAALLFDVVIAALLEKVDPPVSVKCRSGDALKIDFRLRGKEIAAVSLVGPAVTVFEGRVSYP